MWTMTLMMQPFSMHTCHWKTSIPLPLSFSAGAFLISTFMMHVGFREAHLNLNLLTTGHIVNSSVHYQLSQFYKPSYLANYLQWFPAQVTRINSLVKIKSMLMKTHFHTQDIGGLSLLLRLWISVFVGFCYYLFLYLSHKSWWNEVREDFSQSC